MIEDGGNSITLPDKKNILRVLFGNLAQNSQIPGIQNQRVLIFKFQFYKLSLKDFWKPMITRIQTYRIRHQRFLKFRLNFSFCGEYWINEINFIGLGFISITLWGSSTVESLLWDLAIRNVACWCLQWLGLKIGLSSLL